MTDAATVHEPQPAQAGDPFLSRVVVTGATGFVGRAVVRELAARGHRAICLVRDRDRFIVQTASFGKDRVEAVTGSMFDDHALASAMEGADAAVHLVGVIFERPLAGQTFERIHVEGTRRMLAACTSAGVKRFVHMSALGARPRAECEYHRTKWSAEGLVRDSGLDWTIFRPSIIHGPEGEFMRMMKVFVCDAFVTSMGFLPAPFPVIPYFGDGMNKLQPVSVRDVAHCFTAALALPQTIGRSFDMGGPEAMTWKELYRTCRELIPGAKRWKPTVGQPVWAAKLMAMTLMKLPILPTMLRFNVGQVQMSQEDSVCDIAAVQNAFGFKLRDFRRELADYSALIE